jgi:hypothetical protein
MQPARLLCGIMLVARPLRTAVASEMHIHTIARPRRIVALSSNSDEVGRLGQWGGVCRIRGEWHHATLAKTEDNYKFDAGTTCSDVLGVVAQAQTRVFIGDSTMHRLWGAVKNVQEVNEAPIHTTKLASRCGLLEYVGITRAAHWNDPPQNSTGHHEGPRR